MRGIAWLKILLQTTFLVVSATVSGQSISGIITGNDGSTILNAMVQVEGTGHGAISDASGYYTIEDVRPGQYNLIFSHLSYETDTVSVSVAPRQSIQLNKQLVYKISALDEVEIIGKTESQEI